MRRATSRNETISAARPGGSVEPGDMSGAAQPRHVIGQVEGDSSVSFSK